MKRYYGICGSFANAITILAFATKEAREKWYNNEPMSGNGSHYEHNRQMVTAREARHQLATNNIGAREYRRYGAPYSEQYGTTGQFSDIELIKEG